MALTLKAMEYFTVALRHENIARASAELNIAPSAVGAAIDQVEAEFGLTLVTRQRARGIQANANGRAIAQKCERLLDEYRSVLSEGADLKQSLGGRLRIGYYAPVAPAFVPPILDSFLPKVCDAVLDLDECDNDQAQDGLLNGKYDVILFVAQSVRPAIEYDVLIKAPPYCLLPASHPLSKQSTVSIAQLANEPLVVLNRPVAAAYYQGFFAGSTKQLRIAAYANSHEMVRSIVSAGRGCALLNMHPQTSLSYTGAPVVARAISDDLPPLELAIGYDKSHPRRLVKGFVDACQYHFAQTGGGAFIVSSTFVA